VPVGGSMGRVQDYSPVRHIPTANRKMKNHESIKNRESQKWLRIVVKLYLTSPSRDCSNSHTWNLPTFFFKHGERSPVFPSSQALIDR